MDYMLYDLAILSLFLFCFKYLYDWAYGPIEKCHILVFARKHPGSYYRCLNNSMMSVAKQNLTNNNTNSTLYRCVFIQGIY